MLEYKRPKISKIMEEITIALDKWRYIRTDHASLRMSQRGMFSTINLDLGSTLCEENP